MSEKPSAKVGVRTMRDEIAVLAGERRWGDTRESWLARAADKLQNVPYRMVKSFFYGEIENENHWAAIEIRRTAELIEARQEAAALAVQYQKIAGGMRAQDQDFYSAEIDRLERLARIISGQDSA